MKIMLKIIISLITGLILLSVTTFSVYALDENIDEYAQEFDFQKIADSVSDETAEILGEIGIDEISFDELFSVDLKKVIEVLFDISVRSFKTPVSFLIRGVGVLLLTSLCASFLKNSQTVTLVGGAILAVGVAVPVANMVTTAFSVLESLNAFTVSFAGVFCALVSSSGNVALGTSYASLAVFSDSLFSTLLSGISQPAVNAMCSLSFISCFDIYQFSARVSAIAKKIYIWFLGFIATFFSGIVTLKGVMGAGIDSLTARGVRFVVGRTVPVIGGAVSDSYSALVSGLSLIKNTVGVFGIITVLLTVLPSLLEVVAWVLVLSIVITISEFLDEKQCMGMLNILKDALTLLGVTVVFSTVIFVVSVGVVIAEGK